MRISRMMSSSGSSSRKSYDDEPMEEEEEEEEEEIEEEFDERRARLQQLAQDRKQRLQDRASAQEEDGGPGGTLPSEFVSAGEMNAMRERLNAQINKFAAFEDRYARVRAKLGELRQRSAERRKDEFRQRRERRAKLNLPRQSKSEQLARRDSAFVLQQNPWLNINERRRLMLGAITLLSRRKETVNESALRMFQRRSK